MSIITDLMGVKEGECFVVGNTGRMFKMENNKIFENTGINYWKEVSEYNTFLWLVENAAKIEIATNKRGLSKQQITAIKGRIAEGTPWAFRLAGSQDVIFANSKMTKSATEAFFSVPLEDHIEGWFSGTDVYNFLPAEICVYLPDFIEDLEGDRKMTDREKCVLKRDENIILCHYKFIPQVGQLKEELAELIEAADGYIKNTDTEEHFIEEMADVEVMIDQMKIYFDAWEKVNEIKREKVNRQLKRIEAEKNV